MTEEELAKIQAKVYDEEIAQTIEDLDLPDTAGVRLILSTLYSVGWSHGWDWNYTFPE